MFFELLKIAELLILLFQETTMKKVGNKKDSHECMLRLLFDSFLSFFFKIINMSTTNTIVRSNFCSKRDLWTTTTCQQLPRFWSWRWSLYTSLTILVLNSNTLPYFYNISGPSARSKQPLRVSTQLFRSLSVRNTHIKTHQFTYLE